MSFNDFFEKLSDGRDKFLQENQDPECNQIDRQKDNSPTSILYASLEPKLRALSDDELSFETFDHSSLRDSSSDIRNLLQNITMRNLERYHPEITPDVSLGKRKLNGITII